jgi:mRNA-degrading endonuclease YafQ of YafQ-DinJ toxin-antitoxin module
MSNPKHIQPVSPKNIQIAEEQESKRGPGKPEVYDNVDWRMANQASLERTIEVLTEFREDLRHVLENDIKAESAYQHALKRLHEGIRMTREAGQHALAAYFQVTYEILSAALQADIQDDTWQRKLLEAVGKRIERLQHEMEHLRTVNVREQSQLKGDSV